MAASPTPTCAARLPAPARRFLPALAPPARLVPRAAAPGVVAVALLTTAASLPSMGRLAAQQALTGRALDATAAYRGDHAAALVREYADLLAIPNVASDRTGIRRNADEIVRRLEAVGVAAELLELPDASPVVYGALDVPGATRTLGIYVHYDGQPADPSNWTHAPWEPAVYTGSMQRGAVARGMPQDGEPVDPEWRIYARSAGDDKAPIGALIPTLRALRDAGITPTSNLRFLFEGEEEAGSTHLEAYLREWRERWDEVDLWLFFDGPVHQSGRPQLTFGVRGVTGMGLTVYGPTRPLHSGHYGNWAPVPGQMLADLLASMKDGDTGEVLVDGFYETVAPVGRAERDALAALPSYDAELRRELGLARTEGEDETLAERILLPSLTVRGLHSGNVGALARNVIPSTAEAALGIRLVAGNDPERMLDLVEAHIRGQGFHIVREDPDMETRLAHPKIVKVLRGGGYPASRTPMDAPGVAAVIAAARRAASSDALPPDDRELVLLPTLGGSLPLYLFTDVLDRPAVIVPVANHDDNQHAPDENLRIANLWYAMDLYAALLTMEPPAAP